MWQAYLRNWLTQRVREAAYEHVTSAARRAPVDEDASTEPKACDVGVVCALAIEAGGLEDLLAAPITIRAPRFFAREGRLGDRSLVVAHSGVGREAAARAAELLIAGHHPKWVISAGFAGALVPELERGDIVMADSIVDESGREFDLDLRIDRSTLARKRSLHVGRLLTTDSIIGAAADKRRLGEQFAALAVDMESWAVAEVCQRERVRFMAVRVVSDRSDEELPRDLGPLIEAGSAARRFGALTGTIFRRPGSVKDMLRLKQQALAASDRLAKFLASMIAELR